MTRTDVVASSRPQAQGAATTRRSLGARKHLNLPVAMAVVAALAMPSAALAAEEGSGYSQKPTTPTTPTTPGTTPSTTPSTTPTTTSTPTTETSPSKESTSPSAGTSPSKESEPSSTSGTASSKSAKAATLPFTGLDLRWTIGVGLLLLAAGFSIVGLQHRHRRDGGR